jgi:hypothetical protein
MGVGSGAGCTIGAAPRAAGQAGPPPTHKGTAGRRAAPLAGFRSRQIACLQAVRPMWCTRSGRSICCGLQQTAAPRSRASTGPPLRARRESPGGARQPRCCAAECAFEALGEAAWRTGQAGRVRHRLPDTLPCQPPQWHGGRTLDTCWPACRRPASQRCSRRPWAQPPRPDLPPRLPARSLFVRAEGCCWRPSAVQTRNAGERMDGGWPSRDTAGFGPRRAARRPQTSGAGRRRALGQRARPRSRPTRRRRRGPGRQGGRAAWQPPAIPTRALVSRAPGRARRRRGAAQPHRAPEVHHGALRPARAPTTPPPPAAGSRGARSSAGARRRGESWRRGAPFITPRRAAAGVDFRRATEDPAPSARPQASRAV